MYIIFKLLQYDDWHHNTSNGDSSDMNRGDRAATIPSDKSGNKTDT